MTKAKSLARFDNQFFLDAIEQINATRRERMALNEDLIALLQEFIDGVQWWQFSETSVECRYCHAEGIMPDELDHTPECLIVRAQKALADASTNSPETPS